MTQRRPLEKLSETDWADVSERYVAGETAVSLANAFSVSRHVIAKGLEAMGVSLRSPVRLTPEQRAIAVSRMSEGETDAAIAASFGVTSGAIGYLRRSRGIPSTRLPKISNLDKTNIVALYASGQSLYQIARLYGVNSGTVLQHLRRRGVVTRSHSDVTRARRVLSDVQTQEAIHRYAKGESCEQIAAFLGIPPSTVGSTLLREGIVLRSMREAKRRYAVHHEAFSMLTDDASYWCGFIAADGHLDRRSTKASASLVVKLAICDILHLDKLRAFLGADYKIQTSPGRVAMYQGQRINGGPSCTLRITSDPIVSDLTRLAVKTGPLNDALGSNRHFWRGAVDGDGSLGEYANGPKISLCGSSWIVEGFLAFAQQHGFGTRSHARSIGSIYNVAIHGKGARGLIKLLYGHGGVSLDRKQMIASDVATLTPDELLHPAYE